MSINGDLLNRRGFLRVAGTSLGVASVLMRAEEPKLIDNPKGGFRFRKSSSKFSSGGVLTTKGYEIVHVTFGNALPLGEAFNSVDAFLKKQQRPTQALCGAELRCPRQYSFTEFGTLNQGYIDMIAKRDLMVSGSIPVARVNVTPETEPPRELSMYGFSYTAPAQIARPNFLIAASDLNGEYPKGIVARGDVSPNGLRQKAKQLIDSLETNLRELGVGWADATTIVVYTVHDVFPVVREMLLPRIGTSKNYGFHWYLCRPPIVELELEIQVRGCTRELMI